MAINNLKLISEISKKLDETDWEMYHQKERQKRIQGQIRVANKEYCSWLEQFIKKCKKGYDEESFLYDTIEREGSFTEEDIKKEKDLSHFYDFLQIVADIQRVKEYYDDRFFEEYEYVFKFNNKYFEWNTLVGQGSITSIRIIEEPDFCVVDLDKYFKMKDEGKNLSKYKKTIDK